MKKILHTSTYFVLSSDNAKNPKKRGKGHRFYTIELRRWSMKDEDVVRDIIDPNRNISGTWGRSWKFKDKEVAQKKYTMLLLRWS